MTTASTKEIYFSDIEALFAPSPNTGDIARKTNEEAVKRSIRNLLLTDRYERPFQPLLGSNLRRLLFENFTPQTSLIVKQYIEEVFENHEPRAVLLNVIVNPNVLENSLGVTIIFSLLNTNEPVQLDIVLERVR